MTEQVTTIPLDVRYHTLLGEGYPATALVATLKASSDLPIAAFTPVMGYMDELDLELQRTFFREEEDEGLATFSPPSDPVRVEKIITAFEQIMKGETRGVQELLEDDIRRSVGDLHTAVTANANGLYGIFDGEIEERFAHGQNLFNAAESAIFLGGLEDFSPVSLAEWARTRAHATTVTDDVADPAPSDHLLKLQRRLKEYSDVFEIKATLEGGDDGDSVKKMGLRRMSGAFRKTADLLEPLAVFQKVAENPRQPAA